MLRTRNTPSCAHLFDEMPSFQCFSERVALKLPMQLVASRHAEATVAVTIFESRIPCLLSFACRIASINGRSPSPLPEGVDGSKRYSRNRRPRARGGRRDRKVAFSRLS